MCALIRNQIRADINRYVKENHTENAFTRIVEKPDHDNSQKNSADRLPSYPDRSLVRLAPGYDVPDCPHNSQNKACFQRSVPVLQRVNSVAAPADFLADGTNKIDNEKDEHR